MSADDPVRCWPASDPLYVAYHDEEWGRPVTTEQGIYERLCLEGFQSGLSWLTILRKRENFRSAFASFEPDAVARFGERDGTAIQLQSQELDVETLLDLTASLRPVEWPRRARAARRRVRSTSSGGR
ncbi:MAG TPA: DNA-3-methyladenine glycosylase I [Kofleriaceae bacterium]|nr:DNA-3-methyladenine glycosylase I [Kofleriaceae bacterium]